MGPSNSGQVKPDDDAAKLERAKALFDFAEKSYESEKNNIKHLEDKATRLLTALSFFMVTTGFTAKWFLGERFTMGPGLLTWVLGISLVFAVLFGLAAATFLLCSLKVTEIPEMKFRPPTVYRTTKDLRSDTDSAQEIPGCENQQNPGDRTIFDHFLSDPLVRVYPSLAKSRAQSCEVAKGKAKKKADHLQRATVFALVMLGCLFVFILSAFIRQVCGQAQQVGPILLEVFVNSFAVLG